MKLDIPAIRRRVEVSGAGHSLEAASRQNKACRTDATLRATSLILLATMAPYLIAHRNSHEHLRQPHVPPQPFRHHTTT
ncbi:hypothetical protein LA76x_2775 [Lysobacter antibioticus]|uniref:Uncharacterized protein n=1 Tax=Lysobacter antibioticus TaxID=84531 RepID=A0A0S2FBJ0_LYSAN|nr:hypothetical protein LA76x_2775 [Lysobacter antibioticus]